MKILVTGTTGFIGSHLTMRLLHNGYKIRLIVRDKNRLKEEFKEISDIEIIEGDLLDKKLVVESLKGIDILFNLAGNVKNWDTWDNYYSANVTTVDNLIGGVIKNRKTIKKVIHFSTVDVYGYTNTECRETDPADGGVYGYGKSKAIGEKLLIAKLSKEKIPYTVLRPTNVIGPDSQFIKEIGEHYRSGFMLKINGGKVDAGLIYIDNLIEYVMWIVNAKKSNGEIYNLCENNNITWNTFLSKFKLGIKAKAIDFSFPYPTAKFFASLCEVFSRVLKLEKEPLLHKLFVDMFGKTCNHSAGKIRNHSGIEAKINFEEGFEKSIQWFLQKK